MSSEYQRQLEAGIDRELKALPELPAPPALASRVMAAIAARELAPWYRRPWQTWSLGLQAASLVLLLGLFGGLCFAAWRLPHSQTFIAATEILGRWFSGASTLSNALNALAGSLLAVLRNLDTRILAGVLVALALAYAFFIGLGTVYLRIGLARRRS